MKLTWRKKRKEEIEQYRKEYGIQFDNSNKHGEADDAVAAKELIVGNTDVSFKDTQLSDKQKRVEAQWKLMTLLAITRWKKAHPEDKRTDDELAEQWMNEAQREGWCRKNKDGRWELKELKLKRSEFAELGIQ